MSVPLSAINQRTGDESLAERASVTSSGLGGPTRPSSRHNHKNSSGSSQLPNLNTVSRKPTMEGLQHLQGAPVAANYRQGRKLSKQDFIQIE